MSRANLIVLVSLALLVSVLHRASGLASAEDLADKPQATTSAEKTEAGKLILDREKDLRESFADLNRLMKSLQPGELRQERQAWKELQEILTILSQNAERLAKLHDSDLQKYRKAVAQASKQFSEAAQRYETYAAEESNPTFMKWYLAMAASSRRFAEAMQRLELKSDIKLDDWAQKIEFVKRSQVLLTRVRELVTAYDQVAATVVALAPTPPPTFSVIRADDRPRRAVLSVPGTEPVYWLAVAKEFSAYIDKLDRYEEYFNQCVGAFDQLSQLTLRLDKEQVRTK